jgi:hypothetical protein
MSREILNDFAMIIPPLRLWMPLPLRPSRRFTQVTEAELNQHASSAPRVLCADSPDAAPEHGQRAPVAEWQSRDAEQCASPAHGQTLSIHRPAGLGARHASHRGVLCQPNASRECAECAGAGLPAGPAIKRGGSRAALIHQGASVSGSGYNIPRPLMRTAAAKLFVNPICVRREG